VKPPSKESVLHVVHQLKEAGLNVLCDVKDAAVASSH
jgi:hypothetical protein